jgi:hypothetical protein
LENHSQVSAPHATHYLFRGGSQINVRAVGAMKQHLTLMDVTSAKFNQAHNR